MIQLHNKSILFHWLAIPAILVCQISFAFAQDRALIDSLRNAIHQAPHDTHKINALLRWGEQLYLAEPDSALLLWKQAKDLTITNLEQAAALNKKETATLLDAKASCLNNIGYIYMNRGEIAKSIEYYQQSLKVYEETDNLNGKAIALNNIGYIYNNQGENSKALEFYQLSLQTQIETGNKKGQATTMNNIGFIFMNQGLIPQALEYHHNSLKIKEEIADKKGIGESLNNIGLIYKNLGDYENALIYYTKSLKMREEIGHKKGLAICLNNIGALHKLTGDEDKSLEFYQKSLAILQEIGDKKGLANAIRNVGSVFHQKNEPQKALPYYLESLAIFEELGDRHWIGLMKMEIGRINMLLGKTGQAHQLITEALNIAEELGHPLGIKDASLQLSRLYRQQQKYEQALSMYEKHIQMRDSIINQKNHKEAIKQEMTYEFEKKEALLKAEQEKQELVHREKVKRQELTIWAVATGLLIVLIFSGFLFQRFKVTQAQKMVIEDQKKIVDEKNKHITDSINYAKKIQEAILPSKEDLIKAFGAEDHLVFFQPKDIVSGDFYWLHQTPGNVVIWAAADCTGHGVPGAFMSMIGSSLLNEIVIEKGIIKPDLILNDLREGIKKALGHSEEVEGRKRASPSETTVKDGMDIALCTWHKTSNQLYFAGAYNPLYLIRKAEQLSGGYELLETKANRQPVGHYIAEKPFTLQEIDIRQGDTIYLFSDGYIDQFGGINDQPGGKKFTARRLKEMLLNIQEKTFKDQEIMLDQTLENWKHDREQLDDVCVIGVRV